MPVNHRGVKVSIVKIINNTIPVGELEIIHITV